MNAIDPSSSVASSETFGYGARVLRSIVVMVVIECKWALDSVINRMIDRSDKEAPNWI
jgi:hypothetical protein